MGICDQLRNYEGESLTQLGFNYQGLRLCELGNQWTYVNGKPSHPAKLDYTAKGVHHTSIDINGLDGAVALNLNKPLPLGFATDFDVVTNYGTSEHVSNQKQFFLNVDRLCRVGGAMIHVVPFVGNWPDHCRYHYGYRAPYSLASLGEYKVNSVQFIDDGAYQFPRNLIAFTLTKTTEAALSLTTLQGIYDSGDNTYTDNYTAIHRRVERKLSRLVKRGLGRRL